MSSEAAPPTKTLSAHCHCKAVSLTLTLPTSILPLNVFMCHCSMCRHVLGALCCFHAPLPAGVAPEFTNPASLSSYSWPGGKHDWLFCSTCGCHIGMTQPRKEGKEDDAAPITWIISTSLFPKDEEVFKLFMQVLTNSAPGGGAHVWLPSVGGRQLPEHPGTDVAEVSVGAPEDPLLAQCHCKGVTIRFPRPPSASTPFVSPVDASKWTATLCVCDSCRLTTSAHLTAWIYVPLGLVEVASAGAEGGEQSWAPAVRASGVEGEEDNDMGLGLMGNSAVKVYESSPPVRRSFCGTCGATVMYRHEKDGDVVAVSVGIARAPGGTLAEDWVTWNGGNIVGLGDGKKYDPEFTEALAEGLKSWSVEKYGEVYTFPT